MADYPTTKSTGRFNVLIVDDKEENLLTLESILESSELNIVKATSGNEALGLMIEYEFALVLLDVQMPGMDGFETAELMRGNAKTKNIPIIFVTAISTERKHVFKGYETGAVDYLYKPLDLEILQSKIRAFIDFFKHKQELQEATNKLERNVVELNKAKEIAENATKVKSSFLANMSHEIRTPLNGIIGMADLMMMDELSEIQKERLLDMKGAGESLLEIINEILDISKIEADRLELDMTSFSIRELVTKVVRLLSVKTVDNKLELIADIDPSLPDICIGDPLRLRQILINLLGNAIKFTSEGEIIIRLTKSSESFSSVKLLIEVADTGIGIPKHKIDNLFKSYEQASSSTAREYGGTGLGLSISNKIVELMNGYLQCESEEGKGSNFFFEIELDKADEQSNVWELSDELTGKISNIIIADDNKSLRNTVRKYFEFYNITVDESENLSGLNSIIENLIPEKEVIVLIDCSLSQDAEKKDLLKLYNKIDKKHGFGCIIMPQSKSVLIAKKYVDFGVKVMSDKPLLINELLRALEKSLTIEAKVEEVEEVVIEDQNDSSVIRILLAEDQLINRKIAMGLLQKYNCEIEAAENGELALEMFKAKDYDVVLMDVQMPKMDGYQATQGIRDHQAGTDKHTPIIAMTAHAMKGDREKCLAAGMDHYITKPIDAKEVIRTINKYLSKRM